jgi:hypothetical protein
MRSSHSLDRLDRGRRIRALWPTVGASSSPSGPPRVVAHPSNPRRMGRFGLSGGDVRWIRA